MVIQHSEVFKLTDLAAVSKQAYAATASIKLAENAFLALATGIEDEIKEELSAPSLVTDKH